MTTPKLTPAQQEILNFIQEAHSKTGTAPSYREIQKQFGYKSVNSVQTHIEAIRKKGLIAAPQKRARDLVPKNIRALRARHLPIYGVVAAGSPHEAAQIELGTLVISEAFSLTATFALEVMGNSMIEIGIYEGDHVIVDKKSRIKNGDIIVALLDGETTVKRYVEKHGKIYLVPENKSLSPIDTHGKKLEIQGKVVGLQRKI